MGQDSDEGLHEDGDGEEVENRGMKGKGRR